MAEVTVSAFVLVFVLDLFSVGLIFQFKRSLDSWMRGPLFVLDAEDVEKLLDTMIKQSIKLAREISDGMLRLWRLTAV